MSDEDSTSVVVNIYGKNYALAANRDQTAEHIRQVAGLVDEKMREISQAHPPQAPLQIAILAGMELADELFKLQTAYRTAESDIAQRTFRLAASLDRAFRESETESPESSRSPE